MGYYDPHRKKDSGGKFLSALIIAAIVLVFCAAVCSYLSWSIMTSNRPVSEAHSRQVANWISQSFTVLFAGLLMPTSILLSLKNDSKAIAVTLFIVSITVLSVRLLAALIYAILFFTGTGDVLINGIGWIYGRSFFVSCYSLLRWVPNLFKNGWTEFTPLNIIYYTTSLCKDGLFLLESFLCTVVAFIAMIKKK